LGVDSVNGTAAGNRVVVLAKRQGSSASVWSAPGSTAYTPAAVRAQGGAAEIALGAGVAFGLVSVTFPVAFSNVPLITTGLSPQDASHNWYAPTLFARAASGFQVVAHRATTAGAATAYVDWLAVGPE
jgi:hypothetical protein